VLQARGLSIADPSRPSGPLIDGVSFEVRAGEVLGVAGLRGSGASELLHGLSGSLGARARGSVEIGGRPAELGSPARAIDQGVVLLAADRHHSVVGEMSTAHNVTLSSLPRLSRLGWIDGAAERTAGARMIDRLGIVAASPRAVARTLSGGNQQKVALARCLLTRPRVLLLDEPTRGIDVGAKTEVYELIRELAADGLAVMLVASEPDELIELCHRVLVLYRGRVAAELAGAQIRRQAMLHAAMGGGAEAA
jgi:ABC-type sugar transport system ATPase subunit